MDQSDRRPLNTRQLKFSQTLTNALAKTGATPNMISVVGMLFGVVGGFVLAATRDATYPAAWFLAGAACIQFRLLCNMLDGMVAEVQNSGSPVGAIYNEVPDRVSDAATLIGGGYAAGGDVVLGFVAACLALFVAYIRAQGKAAGAPQAFHGPMAKPQRMFAVTVACLYAAIAPLSIQPAFGPFPNCSTTAVALSIIIAGELITVVRRLRFIAASLRSSD
ncbi:MAG: CDP-alcohol phosphatidyltransferase family protein [Planctomycetales bacterium]